VVFYVDPIMQPAILPWVREFKQKFAHRR
jgi:hypothetical protein